MRLEFIFGNLSITTARPKDSPIFTPLLIEVKFIQKAFTNGRNQKWNSKMVQR